MSFLSSAQEAQLSESSKQLLEASKRLRAAARGSGARRRQRCTTRDTYVMYNTSCNAINHALNVLICRREACDNDSPRGGPNADRSTSHYTIGWSVRSDRRCDIIAPPKATVRPGGDSCSAAGGGEALLPIRGTTARALRRIVIILGSETSAESGTARGT